MHEKLKNPQLDTWEELQNAICKEKEARQLETNLEKGSEPIEIVQVPTLPLASVGQKCRTFVTEGHNDDIGMDSDIEYGTEFKILKPNPQKERRIDYHYFYRFDANAISCRHCPYRRPAQKRFKPTNALKSHLKTHHLTVLEQYRRSNDILKEDNGKEQQEGEETIKTPENNGKAAAKCTL
ncbi:hypothetical protein niasHT_031187 [Heterodera trifolii]|uniref:BED-type domain-containing protein n=1 Tax=Heterodera trifolii TaxID=157864 RepID=A0ABD2HZN5_9BILA